MIEAGHLIFLFTGLLGGGLVVWLWQRGGKAKLLAESNALRENLETAQAERDEARKKIEELTNQFNEGRGECIKLETKMQEQALAHEEKIQALKDIDNKFDEGLKNMANKALLSNQEAFLGIAKETFDKHKIEANSDLDKRQEAIQNLLKPISKSLEDYEKNLKEIEKARQEGYGSLLTEVKNIGQGQKEVSKEASKLVNALRAAPKTRGRWGEETLKNVLELSGMSPYCDFSVEKSLQDDEAGLLRPDVIIHLSGDRSIVVDAKTSMAAYMDAVEAVEESEREGYLQQHAQQIREQMKNLASKAYWERLSVTPDFVVMFVPGENFFAAAMEHDPELLEDAIGQKVLVVTPVTLIALAKAIAFGWRQEKVAENAQKVAKLGRDLYKRLMTMGSHVEGVGKGLENAVKRYNDFVGSLETSVLPQARKFSELEVEGTGTPLPDLKYLETDVREPRRDRDLSFEEEKKEIGSIPQEENSEKDQPY